MDVAPDELPTTSSPIDTAPAVIVSPPAALLPTCSRSKTSSVPPLTVTCPVAPSPIASRRASAWPEAIVVVPVTAAAAANVGSPPDQPAAEPHVPLVAVQRLWVSLAPNSLR